MSMKSFQIKSQHPWSPQFFKVNLTKNLQRIELVTWYIEPNISSDVYLLFLFQSLRSQCFIECLQIPTFCMQFFLNILHLSNLYKLIKKHVYLPILPHVHLFMCFSELWWDGFAMHLSHDRLTVGRYTIVKHHLYS